MLMMSAVAPWHVQPGDIMESDHRRESVTTADVDRPENREGMHVSRLIDMAPGQEWVLYRNGPVARVRVMTTEAKGACPILAERVDSGEVYHIDKHGRVAGKWLELLGLRDLLE